MNKFFILFVAFFFACSNTSELTRVNYDKGLKDFNFVRPPKKISIGIIHYRDLRRNWENFNEEFGLLKVSVPKMALNLNEDILKRKWEFASILVIPTLYFPPTNLEEYAYLKKTYEIDYILVSEIKEARIVKIKKPTSAAYKIKIILNKGFLPESFNYESRVLISGRLYSFESGDLIWQGSGYSKIRENKVLTKDTLMVIS